LSIYKKHQYQDIEFFELGFSLWGKPNITVFSYLVDHILIDTGQHHLQKKFLKLLENEKLEKILLTHHHEDHSGNAEAIRKAFKIPVFAGKETIELVTKGFKIKPYQHYMFGAIDLVKEIKPIPEVIETKSFTLYPVFTPGHAPDHYAYLEKERGWLFAGDLYIGKLKALREDENIKVMIQSIKEILKYDFEVLFCAHNPRFKEGKRYMMEKLEYLEEFVENVMHYHRLGYNEDQILKVLNKKKPSWLFLLFYSNNFGVHYLVRSVIENYA